MSARRRLTPHQTEVLGRITRWARTNTGALSATIGSRTACRHLAAKGYITEEEVVGPRGGTTYRYRPTEEVPAS